MNGYHTSLFSRARHTYSKSVVVFLSFRVHQCLKERSHKKRVQSNVKAFRAIDRTADVLQIGRVLTILGRVSPATTHLSKISNGGRQ